MRISWIGIVLSAVVITALRHLWYAHFSGADWGHLPGAAIAGVQSSPRQAGLELASAAMVSLGLAWVAGHTGRSLAAGLGAGLAAGVLFGLTSAADPVIHGAPLGDLLRDGGFLVAAYAIGGAIIGALSPQPARRTKFDWGGAGASEG